VDVTALISLYTSGLAKQTNNQAIDTSNSTGDFASYLNNALTSNSSLESILSSATSSNDSTNLLTNISTNDSLTTMLSSALSSQLTGNLNIAKSNMQQSYSDLIKQIGENPSPELLAKKEQFENDLKFFENTITTQPSNNSYMDINNLSTSSGLDSLFSSNPSSDTNNGVDNSMGDMLSSSFQTQLMSNLNMAKSKMQQGYLDFVSRVGENPSEAAIARIEEMKMNMQSIDQFINTKSNELIAKNAYSNNSKENITAQLNSTMTGLF